MGEVDADFIQPLEHQPKPSILEAEGIPLIDLSPFISQEPDADSLHRLVAEVGEACEKWGFFQVINHGIPSQVRERIELASKEFFALPKEEKRKSSRDETNLFGYSDHEITKSVRDWKEIFDCTIENPTVIYASDDPDDRELKELTSQWPHYPPYLRQDSFNYTSYKNCILTVFFCRETCEEYAAEMQKLALKLLELIALSLGLKKNRFHGFFKDQTSFMRLNYYPSCPSPQLALGLGRHKDAGAMTVLSQDNVGGLEVKRKSDGEWIFVKPMPDAYIVNVGDLIQVWSNDKYESVEHRVTVNSDKARFSVPFFFNPSHYVWVEPLQEMIDEENPPKYKGYSWGKFYATRKLSNFKKLTSENIQVHHFKA